MHLKTLENRFSLGIGIFLFSIFLLLSIYFYLERTIFLDIAFHTFYIIKDQTFAIQNYRFGAALTQIFPLLASKWNFSLSSILLIYSSCFVIVYGFFCFLIGCVFKNLKIGWLLIGYLTLMMSDAFYWIQSEYQLGCVLCLLFFSFILHKSEIKLSLHLLLQIGLLITIVFIHPLLIFVFFFLLIYFFLIKEIHWKQVIFWLLLYISIWLFKNTFYNTAYDSEKYEALDNFINYFPNYYNVTSIQHFLKACLGNYFLFVILSLSVILYYFFSKQFLKLVFFKISVFGYWFLISITHLEVPNNFYIQSMYLPLGIMVFAPLIFEIAPLITSKKWMTGAIVYLAIRLFFIIDAGTWFTERLEWNRQAIAYAKTLGGNKFIADEANVPLDKLSMCWGSSFETLILSSLSHPDSALTILIHYNPSAYYHGLEQNDVFLTQWSVWHDEDMPKQYFNLKKNNYTLIHKNLKEL